MFPSPPPQAFLLHDRSHHRVVAARSASGGVALTWGETRSGCLLFATVPDTAAEAEVEGSPFPPGCVFVSSVADKLFEVAVNRACPGRLAAFAATPGVVAAGGAAAAAAAAASASAAGAGMRRVPSRGFTKARARVWEVGRVGLVGPLGSDARCHQVASGTDLKLITSSVGAMRATGSRGNLLTTVA